MRDTDPPPEERAVFALPSPAGVSCSVDAYPLTSVNFVRCPGWANSAVELEDLDVSTIDPKRVRATD